MNEYIKYIELKTGYSDNGPAWIGKVKFSKSKKTIYFNNKAFMKIIGVYGNYIDIETREEYWISGIKKNEMDRHWTGNGKIKVGKNIVNEYLKLIEKDELDDKKYIIEDIPEIYPIERVKKILNLKL